MYELLGISLALAALLTINAFASLVATGGWRLLERRAQGRSAAARAKILFAMRTAPAAVALIAVGLFLIPAYVSYEPYHTAEVVSTKLAILATISAAGIVFALWRAVGSWFATNRLLQKWLAVSDQVQIEGISIPAYRIPHSFPIIAVVGSIRPRLFIAERVLQSLSVDELKAAIAHERGHLSARDNLRRSVLRACGDVMIVRCGRLLDRAWAEAAESAADEHAAGQNANVALNLASALIEIARMVPVGTRPAIPAGTFLLGDETEGVPARVSHLIELAMSRPRLRNSNLSNLRRHLAKAGLFVLPAVLYVVLAGSDTLANLHSAMEHVVRILS